MGKVSKALQNIKNGELRKIVFLTCRVGNAIDFLKKVSMDFGTVCEAYKRRVQLSPQTNGKVRIHLEGDTPEFGTNIAANEENLMVGAKENDSVLVGPPI